MKTWRIPLIASIAGVIIWWAHRILTNQLPPFDNWFDTAMWIADSACKIVALISIPVALNKVFVHCYQNKKNALKAGIIWAMTGIILLSVLSLLRVPLASALNDDITKFFPTKSTGFNPDKFRVSELSQAIHNWQTGRIFFTEAIIIMLCAGWFGLAGYYSKRFGKAAPGIVAAIVAIIGISIANLASGLLVWDYDFFMAGTLLPSLTLDMIVPFAAMNPATDIGFLAYFCLIWSSWVLDRFLLQPVLLTRNQVIR